MKKLLFFSLIATSALFTFYSCQKETMEKSAVPDQENAAQKDKKLISHLVPDIRFANKQVDAPGCYNGHKCSGIITYPSVKRSRIKWDVDYPASGVKYYVIYKKDYVLSGYTYYNKVDTFSCSATSGVWYARNPLAYNNTTFIITLTAGPMPNAPSSIKEDGSGILYTTDGYDLNFYSYSFNDKWKFTTGTATGSCTITIPKDTAR